MPDYFNITKSVLTGRKYLLIFIFSFFLIALLSAFLMVILSWNALILDGELLISPDLTIEGIMFWLLFSLLASLSLPLYIFKMDGIKSAGMIEGSSTAFGAVLGLFTSACAICQPLLFTLIGLPASFAFLPLNGAEFRLLSLLLLGGSLYLIYDAIEKGGLCKMRGPKAGTNP